MDKTKINKLLNYTKYIEKWNLKVNSTSNKKYNLVGEKNE